MSDDPATREGLPEAYRYLVEAMPRDQWRGANITAMARFWLQIHAGLRREDAAMDGLTRDWREGRLALPDLHRRLIPTLQGFLQHLDGHHNIETHHYFPTMRTVEPRIAAGIDLLDRDHDAIHGHLDDMLKAGRAFHIAAQSAAPDLPDTAARLADVLDAARRPLLRHLEDEEDIVVPLISRHADAFPA